VLSRHADQVHFLTLGGAEGCGQCRPVDDSKNGSPTGLGEPPQERAVLHTTHGPCCPGLARTRRRDPNDYVTALTESSTGPRKRNHPCPRSGSLPMCPSAQAVWTVWAGAATLGEHVGAAAAVQGAAPVKRQ